MKECPIFTECRYDEKKECSDCYEFNLEMDFALLFY